MSRIIAGQWKRHPLPIFNRGPVRPTSSRTRTVLFDTLPNITDYTVADLFSGTGSLGFEALSRGARSLVSIDKQARYISQQKQWIRDHDAIDRFTGYAFDYQKYLKNTSDQSFDLILMDPPYDLEIKLAEWEQLVRHLNEQGWLVYECSQRRKFVMPDGIELDLYKTKQMGDSVLYFYSRGEV